jgi:hypothetical protein
MKKNIAEDLPARKFPQASLSKSGYEDRGGDDRDREGGQEKTPEKRVRQAVYDIKYRARRENIPLRAAYTQYLQNSSMSEQEKAMVREKLFGKEGIVKETYINQVSELASSSVAKALYNIFVENDIEEVNEEYLEELKKEFVKDTKYKVRVTDKSGVSYVRYATREKINSLRANPNIESVEMTEYGEPYEGERSKGEQTAAATSGKDWDGDGKKESPAKEYRGVVHNAIQRERGGKPDGKDTSDVKEDFLGELNGEKTIDVKRGKRNKVVVHHKNNNNDDENKMNESSYYKFLSLINEREMTTGEEKKEKKLKTKYDDSEMKANMIKQYGPEKGLKVYFATIRKQAMKEENCEMDKENKKEEDPRSIPTKISNFKNKLRAAGLKMSYEPDGDLVDEKFDMDEFKKMLRDKEGAVFHVDPEVERHAKKGKKSRKKMSTDPREEETENRYRSDTPSGKRFQGD